MAAQCSGQTKARFVTVLIFFRWRKRAGSPTSHDVCLFPHSCVLTYFIWIHTSHASFPLLMVSRKHISLSDKCSWHFLLMLGLSWHRKSQHGTSCVHWSIWEWNDPESVLGNRGMRWYLKANNTPFCSTKESYCSIRRLIKRGKMQGCWFLHCQLRLSPGNRIYLIIRPFVDS